MARATRRPVGAGGRLGRAGEAITDTHTQRRLRERLGEHLLVPPARRHDTIELIVAPASVPPVMQALHDENDLRYEILSDLCGVDTGRTMQVVYHLWSPLAADWLRVIADGLSRDDPRVPSITFIWGGAEWAEREAYDMLGIIFEGNRDLRRIYMPPDYLGFPLRKDFMLPDDASRSPGEGIRHIETPMAVAETGRRPVLRLSPGTGAVIDADGQPLRVAAGTDPGATPRGAQGSISAGGSAGGPDA